MALIKCKLCGYEAADGRTMHGHFMKCHEKEYRENDLNMELLTDGYKRNKSNTTKRDKKAAAVGSDRPDGFRLLNLKDSQEAAAYKEGYRYIDNNQLVYATDEAKEKGWI